MNAAKLRTWAGAALVSTGAASFACEEEPQPEPSFVPADFAADYPEVRSCRFSVDHDGVYVRVFVDPAAAPAYTAGTYPFAAGTIVVKQYFTDAQCTRVDGYAAMLRLEDGEAPDALDWRWQELDADFAVQDVDVPRCVSCHASCTMGRDGVCTDP